MCTTPTSQLLTGPAKAKQETEILWALHLKIQAQNPMHARSIQIPSQYRLRSCIGLWVAQGLCPGQGVTTLNHTVHVCCAFSAHSCSVQTFSGCVTSCANLFTFSPGYGNLSSPHWLWLQPPAAFSTSPRLSVIPPVILWLSCRLFT